MGADCHSRLQRASATNDSLTVSINTAITAKILTTTFVMLLSAHMEKKGITFEVRPPITNRRLVESRG